MKKFLAVFWMFALVCGLAFGKGQADMGVPIYTEEKPAVLFVAKDGNITDEPFKSMVTAFREKNPHAVIRHLGIDISDGGLSAMIAYVAAGIRPLYKDYAGRVGAFKVEEYALNLSPYVDFSDYYPDVLETVTVDGKVLAIPLGGQYCVMSVNTTILEAAGFDPARCQNWSVDDFLEMARLVRDNTDKTPLAFFCNNQSADYLYSHVLTWFGADMYNDDYTESNLLAGGAGLKAFEMFKLLYDEGFIPRESAVLSAGDYLAMFGRGEVAAWCGWVGWNENFRRQRVENEGVAWWDFDYVPYPKAEGVEKAPLFMQNHFALAPRSDYITDLKNDIRRPKDAELDRLYAELAVALRDAEESTYAQNSYSVRKSLALAGLPEGLDAEEVARHREIVAANGSWDWGLSQMTYSTIRKELFPRLQALFAGEETPEEALETYVENVNRILTEAKIPWIEQ